jgi:hypothetical protein
VPAFLAPRIKTVGRHPPSSLAGSEEATVCTAADVHRETDRDNVRMIEREYEYTEKHGCFIV